MRPIALPELARTTFVVSIEVLPPRGHDVSGILAAFANIPAIVHLTVRDRNRVALESEILGAQALGIRHHLAISGDPARFSDRGEVRAARDMEVPDLIRLCRTLGQTVGVVLDTNPANRHIELRKLEIKLQSGAEFVITQPLYDVQHAESLVRDLVPFGAPVLAGILPLYSPRHTEYLHQNVPGIGIPEAVRARMASATEPIAEGVRIARDTLQAVRTWFQGACIMPPFGHYELVAEILAP
jgi:homocysteine S-methyltransferase